MSSTLPTFSRTLAQDLPSDDVPSDYGYAFAIGASLALLYIPAEAAAATVSGSLALLADAGQKLGYLVSLLLPWGALRLNREPSPRFTFGLGRASILAALAHATLVLVIAGGFMELAVRRFFHPVPVASLTVVLVAAAGLLVNLLTVVLLASVPSTGLRLSKTLANMAGDLAVSGSVLLAGLVIWGTGKVWFDPLVSLFVIFSLVIALWSELKESLGLALAAVPEGIDVEAVRDFLASQPGVVSIHDLHIWAVTTTESFLTCHFVMPDGHPGNVWLRNVAKELRNRFEIHHATIQIELGNLE